MVPVDLRRKGRHRGNRRRLATNLAKDPRIPHKNDRVRLRRWRKSGNKLALPIFRADPPPVRRRTAPSPPSPTTPSPPRPPPTRVPRPVRRSSFPFSASSRVPTAVQSPRAARRPRPLRRVRPAASSPLPPSHDAPARPRSCESAERKWAARGRFTPSPPGRRPSGTPG
ncbi:hypothetical protein DFJ74DRAFT_664107 [Hyaloraphidium curvatum]|nr:hypothetical protein DFJ74DRAFT_664107 [Hyaloraphidium curvatum]